MICYLCHCLVIASLPPPLSSSPLPHACWSSYSDSLGIVIPLVSCHDRRCYLRHIVWWPSCKFSLYLSLCLYMYLNPILDSSRVLKSHAQVQGIGQEDVSGNLLGQLCAPAVQRRLSGNTLLPGCCAGFHERLPGLKLGGCLLGPKLFLDQCRVSDWGQCTGKKVFQVLRRRSGGSPGAPLRGAALGKQD